MKSQPLKSELRAILDPPDWLRSMRDWGEGGGGEGWQQGEVSVFVRKGKWVPG